MSGAPARAFPRRPRLVAGDRQRTRQRHGGVERPDDPVLEDHGLTLAPPKITLARVSQTASIAPGRTSLRRAAAICRNDRRRSAVAWIVTVDRMRGMDAGPGTALGGLGWYLGIWVTMMAR